MSRKTQVRQIHLIPPRDLLVRVGFVLLFVSSIALVVAGRSENGSASRLQNSVRDVLTPIVSALSAPVDAVASASNWFAEIANMRAENIALKNANLQLLKWQSLAKEVQAENGNLRELLNVVPDKKIGYITVRIVADVGGAYSRHALVNAGSAEGIKKNQPIINEKGLVGRIAEVGEQSARALLISDMNSHIPVIAEDSHEKTILVGGNYDLPTLSYMPASTTIKVGERVVTSGDGGVFPKGIPVGIVESVDAGVAKVRPFVGAVGNQYVSVVDYKF